MHSSGPPHATVMCILGMHRSGTSLVARMLNLLGVHLGPDERVLVSGDDNPKGFWEHRPIVDINDEILTRFGGRWDRPPAFPPSWLRDPRLDDLRVRARQLLAEDFAAAPRWGWKDPRTCLTLPFWQELIGPMRYVLCVRNPCAVAASIDRRSGMTREHAERIWLTHVHATLAYTSGQPRMFVFYEDLIEDWSRELRRMAAFIGDPARADDPRVREAVGEFLERELCHHRMSMEDLAGDPRISFPTKALYFAVRGHTGARQTPLDDVLAPTLELNPADCDRGVHKTLDLLADRALEAATLSAEYDELALRQQRALQSIARLESALRVMTLDRDAQARESEAALQTLQEIQTSCAWRLVTLSRGLIVDLLPAGTRRRRIFNAMLWRIAKRLPSPRGRRAVIDLRAA